MVQQVERLERRNGSGQLRLAVRDPGGSLRDGLAQGRQALAAWTAATTRLDLVVLLTLLLLVMRAPTPPEVPVNLLCFAGLVYRPLTRRPAYWFTFVALWIGIFLPRNWTTTDNHKWLMIYWVLALGLAMRSARPLQVLAINARLLLGLVFLFATLWKLASPDFPSGGFFHVTMLTDVRFQQLAEVGGGLGGGDSAGNRAAIDAWDDPTAPVGPTALADGARVALLAQLMAVGTLVLEGLTAIAFLAPARWRIARAREVLLAVFVVATYPVAPVVGFGWLLVIMGLAQSRSRRPVAELGYVLAFLAIYACTELDRVWSLVRRVADLA